MFPTALLQGVRTGLVLFAAGFYGEHDAIWFAQAGVKTTCVDRNADKIAHMEKLYPRDWEFVAGDVFDFTLTTRRWDVVTLDADSNQFTECAEMIDRWCALARTAVVLGCSRYEPITVPVGWELTERQYRSDVASWAILQAV